MDPTARDLFPDFTVVERLDTSPEVLEHAGIVLAQGRHSWYSGHYHRESFAGRARYLFAGSPTYRGVPTDKLVIGNFCQFASGTTFLLGGNQGHDMDAVTPYGFNFVDGATDAWKPVGDTVVGHEVWCGYESTILGGVHLGVGAIIGARAVVAKDVSPFSVVVGDGRVVRHRFDPLRRKLLWRARWWTWDDEHVRGALPLLQGGDVEALARSVGITPDDVAHDPDPAHLTGVRAALPPGHDTVD